MHMLQTGKLQGTNGDNMSINLDEMYPWELEEHLDIRCIRLDGELEERYEYESDFLDELTEDAETERKDRKDFEGFEEDY